MCKFIISENKDNESKVSASDILGGKTCVFINSDNEDKEGKVSALKGTETARHDDAMAKKNQSKRHKQ